MGQAQYNCFCAKKRHMHPVVLLQGHLLRCTGGNKEEVAPYFAPNSKVLMLVPADACHGFAEFYDLHAAGLANRPTAGQHSRQALSCPGNRLLARAAVHTQPVGVGARLLLICLPYTSFLAACTVLEVLKQLAGPVQISWVICGDVAQLGQPGAHRLELPHWVAQGAVQAGNRAKSKKMCGNE